MNKIKISLAVLLLFTNSFVYGQQIIQKGKTYFLSNTLVIKVKQNTVNSSADLTKSLAKFSVKSAQEIYPQKNILFKGGSDLSGIYIAEFATNESPVDLAKKVSKLPGVVWAEPKYIRTLTYTPNDSVYNETSNINNAQPSLKQVHADQAWDITKGSQSVVIGIIDTGVDWAHPDLEANILKDAFGNKIGYDFGGLNGTPDNDPTEDVVTGDFYHYHGTHVAGIAGAVTDNNIGVASIGFNCSILPVKVSRSDQRTSNGTPYVYYGFDGIKWAADNGAKVLSCSWGGYGFSAYEQSIIDYAIAKGAVVIAAQGNDGSTDPFYPADYKGVLSVGWLDTGINVGQKNYSANYGEEVKVFAPGTNIPSTWQRVPGTSRQYFHISGSSMAAPLVSGLAGLVWTKFPDYTPMQIEERIRVTADNIDEDNGLQYSYLLGSGRINAYKAVSTTNPVSVRADKVKYFDMGNGNGIFEVGEKVGVEINFVNYLSSVGSVNVTLTTKDKYVTIENASFDTGGMTTLDTVSNNTNRFVFRVNSDAPFNHDVHFMLQFNNGSAGYDDFQWINVRINPTYRNHDNNNISMTVTSEGNIGYDDYPNNSAGSGFSYKGGENLMFEGSFMYGTSQTQIMNAARVLDQKQKDFVYNTPISISSNGDQQIGFGIFSDSGTVKLGIQTILSTYSYTQTPDNNYIILKSLLNNNTDYAINNLYAGYFIDWDIPESAYDEDTTYFDEQNKIAIAYNKNEPSAPYTGVALISNTAGYGYYGIDNTATTGIIQMNDADGFTNADKWYALHNGVSKRSAGVGDISIVVSGGPYNIPSKNSVDVAFAIAAGATLNEVIDAVQQSKIKYQSLTDIGNLPMEKPAGYQLYQNYPNPFNPTTIISYQLPAASHVTLKIFDVLGREVAVLVNENQKAGSYHSEFSIHNLPAGRQGSQLPSGVYFYRLTAGDYSSTRKMLLLK